jgi:hypothetical protein
VKEMGRVQALYQTNIDCDLTHEKAWNMGCMKQKVSSVSRVDQSQALRLKLNGLEDVVALISSHSILQVTFSKFEELDAFKKILEDVAVTGNGEPLQLEPMGCFSLVDRIRSLIQDGRIGHETTLSLEELAELTKSDKSNIKDEIPSILEQKYPYGIELKVATVRAGCQRAEPYIEEWLGTVERALRAEEFYSPDPFEWQSDQYFELVKLVNSDVNGMVVARVRAFLNGTVITEATPKHLAEMASRTLHTILEKYSIPYDIEMRTETRTVNARKTWLTLFAVMGIAFGALGLYNFQRQETPVFNKKEEKLALATLVLRLNFTRRSKVTCDSQLPKLQK